MGLFSDSSILLFVESPEPLQLVCATCGAEFAAAWDLCQHVQLEHGLSIYKDVRIYLYIS